MTKPNDQTNSFGERPWVSSDGPPCCYLAGKGLSVEWSDRPECNNGALIKEPPAPTGSTRPGLSALSISCPPRWLLQGLRQGLLCGRLPAASPCGLWRPCLL